jgi:hypothetical protein
MSNHNSFYKVGQTVFYSKTLALFEATKLNIHPSWHFADDIFSTVKWNNGSVENINDLYKSRARQLREKYDYLVLMYSGGADSRTILESFLSQGLLVDELLVCWPREITQGRYKVSTDKSATNMLSEFDLVVKPDLEYISKNYPAIRITLKDWSTDVATDTAELIEDDWYSINDHMNPGVFKKYTVISDTEKSMIDAGKKSATIWGVDKPQIAYKDGNIYVYFLDKLANTRSSDNHNNRISELFYWSPDMPNIVHGQARLVYEYFIKHPEKLKLVDWTDSSGHNKSELNLILKSIIYPNWHPGRFQADKSTSTTTAELDTWFFKDYNYTRYFQSWQSGLTNIAKAVDIKYHQKSAKANKFEGWVGFISPFYLLGPAYQSG